MRSTALLMFMMLASPKLFAQPTLHFWELGDTSVNEPSTCVQFTSRLDALIWARKPAATKSSGAISSCEQLDDGQIRVQARAMFELADGGDSEEHAEFLRGLKGASIGAIVVNLKAYFGARSDFVVHFRSASGEENYLNLGALTLTNTQDIERVVDQISLKLLRGDLEGFGQDVEQTFARPGLGRTILSLSQGQSQVELIASSRCVVNASVLESCAINSYSSCYNLAEPGRDCWSVSPADSR